MIKKLSCKQTQVNSTRTQHIIQTDNCSISFLLEFQIWWSKIYLIYLAQMSTCSKGIFKFQGHQRLVLKALKMPMGSQIDFVVVH